MDLTLQSKTCSLVLALCKLPNYCKSRNHDVPQTPERDVINFVSGRALFLPRLDGNSALWVYDDVQDHLGGLLDHGDHTDDEEQGQRRAFWRHDDLPYKAMPDHIEKQGNQRPALSRKG